MSSSPPVTRSMRCAAGTGKTPWATDLPHPRDRPPGPDPAKVERRLLAHLDTGRTSNGPTEAINGIIELGRRTARGYRNHNNHRLRNLLEVGGPARHLHRKMRKRITDFSIRRAETHVQLFRLLDVRWRC